MVSPPSGSSRIPRRSGPSQPNSPATASFDEPLETSERPYDPRRRGIIVLPAPAHTTPSPSHSRHLSSIHTASLPRCSQSPSRPSSSAPSPSPPSPSSSLYQHSSAPSSPTSSHRSPRPKLSLHPLNSPHHPHHHHSRSLPGGCSGVDPSTTEYTSFGFRPPMTPCEEAELCGKHNGWWRSWISSASSDGTKDLESGAAGSSLTVTQGEREPLLSTNSSRNRTTVDGVKQEGLPKLSRECLVAEVKCYGYYVLPPIFLFLSLMGLLVFVFQVRS